MADPSIPTNGVAVWSARLKDVLALLASISLTTLLMILLGLVIATYYGWITSTLVTTDSLREHDERTARYFIDRSKIDMEFLQTIRDMRVDMTRNSLAYRIRICSDIKERELRERCLSS